MNTYKFWVYVISDGNSKGLLIKRQASPSTAQECKYFHFAGGLSPTSEILHACKGSYVQLIGNRDEIRFVDGLINYVIQDQVAGSTKRNQVICKEATDGQTYQVVVNHFFGRAESPLLEFFINANIFKQAVLCKVRNKDEYIGLAEEFGVLSPHNLTLNDLKYIRPIGKVLKVGEENEAKWFRKSGSLAIDFDNDTIYMRKEVLDDLKSKVIGNFGSILEGDMATGKTVIVRHLGYMLRKDGPVYYFDCDGQRDFDLEILAGQINSLSTGIFIFENIHLEIQKFQLFFSRLQQDGDKHILFTTRPSFRETHTSRFEGIDVLPRIELEPFDDVDQIVDHFGKYHATVPWSAEICEDIKDISQNNFWLLSYALKGYVETQGNGEPNTWLKSGVKADLNDLEIIGADAPRVVVALSALYQNEVLTSARYLLETLTFNAEILKKLAMAGEITKQVIDGDIFYGLPDSSLAMAYWEHGTEYRNLLKYSDYKDFIYNYTISGVSNGLDAVIYIFSDVDHTEQLLKCLHDENLLNTVAERASNIWTFASLIGIEKYEYLFGNNLIRVISKKLSLSDDFYGMFVFFLELEFHNKSQAIEIIKSLDKRNIACNISKTKNLSDAMEFLYVLKENDTNAASEIINLIDYNAIAQKIKNKEVDLDAEAIIEFIQFISNLDNTLGSQFAGIVEKDIK